MKKETLSLLFFYGWIDLITFMSLSFISLSSLCLSSCSYIHLFFTDLTALPFHPCPGLISARSSTVSIE